MIRRVMLFVSLSIPVWVSQVRAGDLAERAQTILKQRCHHCHGESGSNEGGFNHVLDLRRLKAGKFVVPGNPEGSVLLERITSGDMPADGEMSEEEIDVIRQWIEAGAEVAGSDESLEFVSTQEMFALIQQDIVTVPAGSRRFQRYFTFTHLVGAGGNAEVLRSYRQGLSKLVNSLSWGNEVVVPQPINGQPMIFRIDLRDYQWNDRTWDRILEAYPYKLELRDTAAEFCQQVMETDHPCLRGDWFVAASSVPPLYHDILQIPETQRELEEMIGVDVQDNIDSVRAVRGGFNGSGVSRNNRMIERHSSQFGAFWVSYDFSGNAGDKNIFSHPLGPRGDNAFDHDGGEIIFNLTNGLQGYMLVDADGNRIDKGPTAIVSDPQRPDRAVVNGLSCMSCHAKGIIPKADQVHAATLNSLELFSAAESQLILALYPKTKRLASLMAEDSQRFVAALAKAGVTDLKNEPVSALVQHFESELDVDLAAGETGFTSEQFLRALQATNDLALEFAPLRTPGGTIQREVFLSHFTDLAEALGLEHEILFDSLKIKLVNVPAGAFSMGSPQNDKLADLDERNQHLVRITKPFFLSAHEVTVRQYQQFVDDTGHQGPFGYRFDPNKKLFIQNSSHDWRNPGFDQTDDHPVVNVSHEDAVKFCRWLSEREGVTYRLPTEAEWEYACRAGTQSLYFSGDSTASLTGVGNIADVSLKNTLGNGESLDDGEAFTARVGQYRKNAFGLFDMHGNVLEWCSDRYDAKWYRKSPTLNPAGPAAGKLRVVRGGSWASMASSVRAAERLAFSPESRNLLIGFRVVREK